MKKNVRCQVGYFEGTTLGATVSVWIMSSSSLQTEEADTCVSTVSTPHLSQFKQGLENLELFFS